MDRYSQGMDWTGIKELQSLGQKAQLLRELGRQRDIDFKAARMQLAGIDPTPMLMERMNPPERKGIMGFLGNLTENAMGVPRGLSQAQQGLLAQTLAGQRPEPQQPGMLRSFLSPQEQADLDVKKAHAQYWQEGGGYGRGGNPAAHIQALQYAQEALSSEYGDTRDPEVREAYRKDPRYIKYQRVIDRLLDQMGGVEPTPRGRRVQVSNLATGEQFVNGQPTGVVAPAVPGMPAPAAPAQIPAEEPWDQIPFPSGPVRQLPVGRTPETAGVARFEQWAGEPVATAEPVVAQPAPAPAPAPVSQFLRGMAAGPFGGAYAAPAPASALVQPAARTPGVLDTLPQIPSAPMTGAPSMVIPRRPAAPVPPQTVTPTLRAVMQQPVNPPAAPRKFGMGETVTRGGRQWKVVGYDSDGEPLVEPVD